MNNLEQKRILNSPRFQIKMVILALTDPQRSEAEYWVSPVHLSPQLQRQRRALSDINLRSQEQESQLSGICAASSQSWGELPRTAEQVRGSGALCHAVRLKYHSPHEEKKLAYHFLNICYDSRILPPVSWRGLVRLTWSGLNPIGWLLLQPHRARTCQLLHREAGCWSLSLTCLKCSPPSGHLRRIVMRPQTARRR